MKIKTYLLIVLVFAFSGLCDAQSDIQLIKERVVKELMKPEVNDDLITQLIENLKEDGTWPGINYEDVSKTEWILLVTPEFQKL